MTLLLEKETHESLVLDWFHCHTNEISFECLREGSSGSFVMTTNLT